MNREWRGIINDCFSLDPFSLSIPVQSLASNTVAYICFRDFFDSSRVLPYMYSMTHFVYFKRMIDKLTWEHSKDIYLYTFLQFCRFGISDDFWQNHTYVTNATFHFAIYIRLFNSVIYTFPKEITIHWKKNLSGFLLLKCLKVNMIWKYLVETFRGLMSFDCMFFYSWWSILKLNLFEKSFSLIIIEWYFSFIIVESVFSVVSLIFSDE